MGATHVLATAPAMPPEIMFLMEPPLFGSLVGEASAAADTTMIGDCAVLNAGEIQKEDAEDMILRQSGGSGL
jgi:hypothetical protein